jgi:flagellar basal body-associated protein FliL
VKKGVMIAIGVGIAIAIVVVLGLTVNTGKETKIALNSTNITPVSTPTTQTSPPPSQPVTQGRNFSVNLTENVGVGAH